MNTQAIYHRQESNYCFAVTDSPTVTLRLRIAKGDSVDRISVIYNCKYLLNVQQNIAVMTLLCSDINYDYYTCDLTLDDRRLAYVFLIEAEGKSFYFCEEGVCDKYDFNFSYYNCFQYAYLNQSDTMPVVPWLSSATFYQIFPDRFLMGKDKKDKSYINMQWGDKPTPKSFAGGDLNGVTQKLDYIKSLGITAIYLTPIFVSPTNHKYDTENYFKVDEHFGGNVALRKLVNKAHALGMKVVLDAVFNHCSNNIPQFRDVVRRGNKSRYYDWFFINGDSVNSDKINYEVFGHCAYMPKLNTNNVKVQRYLCNVAKHWMKKYKIDGWRLDVSDEVSHSFWRVFRKTVKAINPNAVLIGENWHNAESFLQGDQFDGIMNYNFNKNMLQFFAKGQQTAQQLACTLNGGLMRYTDSANANMFNLLDCHDTHRFYSEVKQDKNKVLCATAIEIFYPGATCFYYGTEILMEGQYDPDSRRCFDWERTTDREYLPVINTFSRLLALKSLKALCGGMARINCDEQGFFEMRREDDIEELILTLNFTGKSVEKSFDDIILTYNTDGKVMKDYSFVIQRRIKV